MKNVSMRTFALIIGTMFSTQLVYADEIKTIELIIENHTFTPPNIEVKAGEKFKLSIVNKDKTFEEFESRTMVIEKFVFPGKKLEITIGPLKPGSYDFFGDFHKDTAKGQIVAK